MSEARRDREAATEAVEDLTATSLDKVREILFGQELRKSDQRFAKMEERLVKELTALGSDTKKRLDALDSVSRAELDGLSKAVRLESSEREALGKELARAMQEIAKTVDKKIAQADAQFVKALREAQAELAGEVRGLREELKKAVEESQTELNNAHASAAGLEDRPRAARVAPDRARAVAGEGQGALNREERTLQPA